MSKQDLASTTMLYVASMLFYSDPGNEGADFQNLSDSEKLPWNMRAVAIINAAEPLWRSRTAEDREATVGTLQSLSRMAMLRGIPRLGTAESTYDRELVVQEWIAECAERYAEIGRV